MVGIRDDERGWLTECGVADTWIGMVFVLGGIALCVQSKNT